MSHNTNAYFTHGKYDSRKSEQRREEIKQSIPGANGFTPRGVNTQEYIHQRSESRKEASHRLISTVMTGGRR